VDFRREQFGGRYARASTEHRLENSTAIRLKL
jgi:hypothetical protein